MTPCELLFALGAARECAPSRRWRLDGRILTDGDVRVTSHSIRGASDVPMWFWMVRAGGRARMVDVKGLLRALEGLEGPRAALAEPDPAR